uniref:Uncharacterized protein n=1 Tax=Cacopsylla melanoneura TaxID=428564 RepID=A0A8D8XYG9_9HEMI
MFFIFIFFFFFQIPTVYSCIIPSLELTSAYFDVFRSYSCKICTFFGLFCVHIIYFVWVVVNLHKNILLQTYITYLSFYYNVTLLFIVLLAGARKLRFAKKGGRNDIENFRPFGIFSKKSSRGWGSNHKEICDFDNYFRENRAV